MLAILILSAYWHAVRISIGVFQLPHAYDSSWQPHGRRKHAAHSMLLWHIFEAIFMARRRHQSSCASAAVTTRTAARARRMRAARVGAHY